MISTSLTLALAVACQGPPSAGASPAASAAPDSKAVVVEALAAWSQDGVSVSGSDRPAGEGRTFIVVLGRPAGQKNAGAFHTASRDASGAVVGFRSDFNEGGFLESKDAALTDSRGARYVPVAGISGSFAFFRGEAMLARQIRIEIPEKGAAAAFALFYEVPKERSGFRLSVGKAEPVTIELPQKK